MSSGDLTKPSSLQHPIVVDCASLQVLNGRAGGVYMALPAVAANESDTAQQQQQGAQSPEGRSEALWQHSTLTDNTADTAGAAYLAGTGDGSVGFRCWNCTLSSNTARNEVS